MQSIDLTPFGFTPTESMAYGALLQAGPSSGYAVAKLLSIARANAYQALHGLAAKHAAEVSGDEPRVFRAVQPTALLARIARDSANKVEVLERQIDAAEGTGAPDTVPFSGEAEFKSLLMRLAVRDEHHVSVIAPPEVLVQTLPVWRTRLANNRPTSIWSIGPAPEAFPVPVAGVVDRESARKRLGEMLTVVVAQHAALLANHESNGVLRGFWSSDPIIVAAARGAGLALQS